MAVYDAALNEILSTAGWSTQVDSGHVDESLPMIMDIDGCEYGGGEGEPMDVDGDEYGRWGERITMRPSVFRWFTGSAGSAVDQLDGDGDTVMNLEDPDPDIIMGGVTEGSPGDDNNGPPVPMSSGPADGPAPITFNLQPPTPELSGQISNGAHKVPEPDRLNPSWALLRAFGSTSAPRLGVNSVTSGSHSPELRINTLENGASSQSPSPPEGNAPGNSTFDSHVFPPRPSSLESRWTTPGGSSPEPGQITALLEAWAHAFTAVCPEDFRLNDQLRILLVNASTAPEDAYIQLSVLLADIGRFEDTLRASPGHLDDPAERRDNTARRQELISQLYEMIHRRGLEVGMPVQRPEKPTSEILHKRANASALVALLGKPVRGSALAARGPRDYRLQRAGPANRGQWALHRAGRAGPLAVRTPEPPKGPRRGASRPPLGGPPRARASRLTKRRWRTGAWEGSGVLRKPAEDKICKSWPPPANHPTHPVRRAGEPPWLKRHGHDRLPWTTARYHTVRPASAMLSV